MKKVVFLFLVIILIASGCGKKPSNISPEMYEQGCKALEVCDQYLDDDISLKTGYKRMDEIEDEAHDLFYDGLLLDDDTNRMVKYYDGDSAVYKAIEQLKKDFSSGDDIKKDTKALKEILKK